MRRRMSSDNPFHAAIRPDSRTKAGISPTAHKCAHSNSKDAVFGDKTRGNSSPISPIISFCSGSHILAFPAGLSQLVRAAAAGGDHREVAERPAPRNEAKVLIERWRKAHNVDGG